MSRERDGERRSDGERVRGMRAFALSNANDRRTRGGFVARRLLLSFAALCSTLVALPSKVAYASDAYEWRRQETKTFAWLHAVYFLDESRGWAVGGKGAFLSTVDGGRTWQARRSPTEDTLLDIRFTDERTGWMVCERDFYKLRTETEARSYLLKTTDGGESWSRIEAAGKDVNARLAGIAFADKDHGWTFGEEGALFVTKDGGETWTRQLTHTRRLLLSGAFRDANTGWLAGAGATLLYTSDGGATWRAGQLPQTADSPTRADAHGPAQAVGASAQKKRPPRINALSFIDERRGWAVGSGGAIFSTVNGGRTWRALKSNTEENLFDVKFFDESEGWAVGSGGAIIRTTDGGETWRAARTDAKHQLEGMFFLDRTRGWAVGFGGTIVRFDASSDRPQTLKINAAGRR